jgi:hypothetical protein
MAMKRFSSSNCDRIVCKSSANHNMLLLLPSACIMARPQQGAADLSKRYSLTRDENPNEIIYCMHDEVLPKSNT